MRPCLMSQKSILLTFKGFCMNFSLELKKIILSHTVTSKQPHKIVQILMRHPVDSIFLLPTSQPKPKYIGISLKCLKSLVQKNYK